MDSLKLDLTAQHMDYLMRNLSGFNLEVDKIAKNGNCFFRAVTSRLSKHLRGYREHIEEHCTSLGLVKHSTHADLGSCLWEKPLITLKSTKTGWQPALMSKRKFTNLAKTNFLQMKLVIYAREQQLNSWKFQLWLLPLSLQPLWCHSYHTSSLLPHPSTLHVIILGPATMMLQKILNNC